MAHVARYSVGYGLQGCYLDDSHYGTFECATRAELAALIRDALEFYEMPACKFKEVGLRKLWGFIRRNGSSVAHFNIQHGAHVLNFYGLTEEEYNAAVENDYA